MFLGDFSVAVLSFNYNQFFEWFAKPWPLFKVGLGAYGEFPFLDFPYFLYMLWKISLQVYLYNLV